MNAFKKIWCRTYQFAMRVARPFLPYKVPKPVESLKDIPALFKIKKIEKVMLVTDKSIRGLGLTKELEKILKYENIDVAVFDNVVPNPTVACVEEGLTIFKQRGSEAIIAFGGGSVMDCAKIIGARSVKPKKSVKQMKGLMKIRKKLPLFVAVPTTAGTGSEVTVTAVITDDKTHEKFTINDFNLIAHFAVLDPMVTVGLPAYVTSTTGMDALTHAVEAYIGKSTTAYTRRCSEEAVIAISKNLYKAYKNGEEIDARREMLVASYKAGLAFTRSYVGYVHAVAHTLGGAYGVPHGLANAVILPYFLERYGKSVYKPLGRLAKLIGLCQSETEDNVATTMFINWIREFNEDMGIPSCIEKLERSDINKLAKIAEKEANPLYPVPVLMNATELEEMYVKLLK